LHGAVFAKLLGLEKAKKFPTFYEKPTCHYLVHKSSLYVPIPRLMNIDHVIRSYIFKIYFRIISPSTPRSFKWVLCFRIPHRSLVYVSVFLQKFQILCPPHLSRFHNRSFRFVTTWVFFTVKSF